MVIATTSPPSVIHAIPATWVALAPHEVAHGAWRFVKVAASSHDRDALSMDGPLSVLISRLPQNAAIVMVVPLTRCIVMALDLPFLHGLKLQQALAGVLGDRLIGASGAQHFAAASSMNGRIREAAACDAVWLKQCLDTLADAGLRVAQVIPEASLLPTGSAWWGQLQVEQSPAWLVRTANGEAVRVSPTLLEVVLPSAENNQHTAWRWFADPACDKPPALDTTAYTTMSAATLLRNATHTTWDLRQFAFAPPDAAARLITRMANIARTRSGRFALGALLCLVVVNVLGLNLYALKQQHAINARHAEMERIVTEALPGTPRLVEPALQLEAAWLRARGATAQSGTATLLGIFALTASAQTLTMLDASDRALRATFADSTALERGSAACRSVALRDTLQRAGVRCTREGEALQLNFSPDTALTPAKG